MKKIEEIYNRLEGNKRALREHKKMIKDVLAQDTRYVEIEEEMKALRTEKKMIENDATSSQDVDEMDDLKIDIRADKELLADMALNTYVKGETVEVFDEYDQCYVPIFSVKFKKN